MARTTFLDRDMIQSYYDQVKGSLPPEKRREIGVELSITGPKVHATQTEHAIDASESEMIGAVVRFHEKNGSLVRQRPLKGGATLVLERCRISRVEVPSAANSSDHESPLVIWVSLGEATGTLERPTRGTLCLLQRRTGQKISEISRPSEYSIFLEMVLALSEDGHKNLLAERLSMTRLDLLDGENAWNKMETTLEPFAIDPVGTLERLGCKAGTPAALRSCTK